jgi:hypothetical protein
MEFVSFSCLESITFPLWVGFLTGFILVFSTLNFLPEILQCLIKTGYRLSVVPLSARNTVVLSVKSLIFRKLLHFLGIWTHMISFNFLMIVSSGSIAMLKTRQEGVSTALLCLLLMADWICC